MDEMIVRPKYSRQTSTPRNRKRSNETEMMSTFFAVKMLAVVVFLSVYALCKAADTPATSYFVSRVKVITTQNFDAGKYLTGAATALGVRLPERNSSGLTGSAGQLPDTDAQTGDAAGGLAQTVQGGGQGSLDKAANEGRIENKAAGLKGEPVSGEGENSSDLSSGFSTGSSSIDDTLKAITEVPVLEESQIKAIADKYSFVTPIKGEIESPFGIRTDPLSGKTAFHSGIDIRANMGTSIKAALDGEVTEVGSSPEYDNYVKVKHNDGLYTVYAHCSILVAQKGQKVKQGDVVAKVGDTEGLSGALHFEIWKDDKAVDPEKLLNLLNQ
ncbi:murein DD-endopeptidase MepM [Ruminiclostridium hungatei]|uniref:Murein DD-endopeptidase MepM n=1 Tax=Ruminiclostridium hungatei TaxID=48256 RepID=A0A1V4SFP9_RUMHU|nr:M23 family metallopeptidase [Ruminiclostridium hungatei]OPX42709.1 murein DD-endopeptidase MepM [Ruminiclostridium hungatei]